MNANRKRIVQVFCVLLALPVLYVVSSGPVLLIAARKDEYHVAFGHTVSYYRPLFRLAQITHLEPPLSRYLHWWGIALFRPPWPPGSPAADDPAQVYPLHSGRP